MHRKTYQIVEFEISLWEITFELSIVILFGEVTYFKMIRLKFISLGISGFLINSIDLNKFANCAIHEFCRIISKLMYV